MKLSKDCGANIGRHYYEENYEVLEKMLDEFSSRTYENMNDDEKTKINDLILSRKKEFENLDMTKLNTMLQHLFGDIISLPEKWWLDYDLLEKLNGTYEEYINRFAKEVPTDYIMFDHYPIRVKNRVEEYLLNDYLYNCRVVANAGCI